MKNETAHTIKDILEKDNYIIPRYQRNYAWERAEISQLIKDINEFFSDIKKDKSYYLGSLVCFKRENGSFELIDGQQRHTTLTLINLVLKNWKKEDIKNVVSFTNLKFDSRKNVQNYIENLYKTEKATFQEQVNHLNNSSTGKFKDAIEIIQGELQGKDVQKFANNFYENVYLFRVEVPQDTDLNHYFEIMNNRGEQLEKHEIVKARLMDKINEEKQKTFAEIWDACADMNSYVYFNFKKKDRETLFDKEGNLNIDSFDKCSINGTKSNEESDELLEDIVSQIDKYNTLAPQEEKFIKDKYKSVIDFSNFLLQVLKTQNDEVSLDDKKLLDHFEESNLNSEKFIFDLLKYRVLFDKYVIKQDLADVDENKQNWNIRKLKEDFEAIIKTFNKNRENDDDLIKLQVLLYYSDTTNTYNNWLQEILRFLDKNISCEDFTKKVFKIAKDKFLEKYKENLSYPNIRVFDLYFIDFLLWKLYKTENVAENLKSLKDKINNLKGKFDNFKFKQLNSREHLFSQEHAKRYGVEENVYNGIGNLCLISTSQNSAGNKENPIDKKKMFKDDNSSLKRLIMFESYESDEWKAEQIKKHEEEIKNLIEYYVK